MRLAGRRAAFRGGRGVGGWGGLKTGIREQGSGIRKWHPAGISKSAAPGLRSSWLHPCAGPLLDSMHKRRIICRKIAEETAVEVRGSQVREAGAGATAAGLGKVTETGATRPTQPAALAALLFSRRGTALDGGSRHCKGTPPPDRNGFTDTCDSSNE